MNRRIRKIILYGMVLTLIIMFFRIPWGRSLYCIIENSLCAFFSTFKTSPIFIGYFEFIGKKENSWQIVTAFTTTFIAIVSLVFLYIRIRNQDKLLKETIASNASNRFRDAVTLLADEKDAVVTGAIYLLDNLAREQPSKYADLVLDVLCGYLRNETPKRNANETSFPDKYQTVLNCLFRKGIVFKDFVYRDTNLKVDLSKTNLSFADLSFADLSSVNLIESNLKKASLYKASLANANLSRASLEGTDFAKAFLIYSKLIDTNLQSAINVDKATELLTIDFGGTRPEFFERILEENEKNILDYKVRNKLNTFLKSNLKRLLNLFRKKK